MEEATILTNDGPVKGQVIPLVRATRLSTPRGEFFTVRCPFCKGEHVHGALQGMRVAHCHVGSYLLREGAADDAVSNREAL